MKYWFSSSKDEFREKNIRSVFFFELKGIIQCVNESK